MQEADRKEVGNRGEQLALDHLLAKGLQLVMRNYRCNGGELDLVMLDGATLALVEVRVRHHRLFGGPAASITPAKQRRLIFAAKHLFAYHRELARRRARFDVVAIDKDASGATRIEWIRDAFRA